MRQYVCPSGWVVVLLVVRLANLVVPLRTRVLVVVVVVVVVVGGPFLVVLFVLPLLVVLLHKRQVHAQAPGSPSAAPSPVLHVLMMQLQVAFQTTEGLVQVLVQAEGLVLLLVVVEQKKQQHHLHMTGTLHSNSMFV